jgi:glyoxalase/bleomycin resistance protein/dioxygenase superfamily protein
VLLALRRDPSAIVPNWKIVDKTWNVYIRVDDAHAIYSELQERGAPIDYTIYDAPHGFREFGMQDPDGHDVASGNRSDLPDSDRGSHERPCAHAHQRPAGQLPRPLEVATGARSHGGERPPTRARLAFESRGCSRGRGA